MDRRDGRRGRLGAALLVCLLLVGLMLAALPSAGQAPGGDPAPRDGTVLEGALPQAFLDAELQREAALSATRNAPGADRQRVVTRMAFAHLSDADALAAGRRE